MYVFSLLIKFEFSHQHLNTGKFLTCFDKTMQNRRSGDAGPQFLSGSKLRGEWLAQTGFVHLQPLLPLVEHFLSNSVMDLTCLGPWALELETP